MAYSRTVAQLKSGIAGLLTGTNLNNVTNLYNAIERGVRNFLGKASIPEASATQTFTLFDGVYDYVAPDNIFGSTLRDFRPVGLTRLQSDYTYRVLIEDFDRGKVYGLPSGVAVTFEPQNGKNIMRVKENRSAPQVVIDPMNDTDGWTASGTAGSLALDQTVVYKDPGSLRFTLTGAGTGYLTKTLTNSLDLTDYANVASFILELNIPTTNLTSVTLRIGSDSSNYYEISQTHGMLGSWTTNDFLDTQFDWSTATKVGTPDITAIDYVRLAFVTSGTITNIRCGYLFCSLPSVWKMFYQTNSVFQHGSTISNFITDDTDIILLNDSAYNLLEYECAISVGIQNGGSLSQGLVGTLNSILNGARARNGAVLQLGLYDKYKADNPAEEIRSVGSWY